MITAGAQGGRARSRGNKCLYLLLDSGQPSSSWRPCKSADQESGQPLLHLRTSLGEGSMNRDFAGRTAAKWPPSSFNPRLESRGLDLIRGNEAHTLWRRNRRRQWPQERRTSVVDFPAHQHGVVFMHRVVAVLHVHPAPIAELHGERNAAA